MVGPLFDALPDAVLLVDRQGNIVRANPQAERLFGYSASELVGNCVETLVPEASRQRHRQVRSEFSNAPKARAMGERGQTLMALREDGSTIPVEIALSPLQTENGKFVLASIRDVSETQRVHRELVRARYDSLVARIGQWVVATPNQFDILKQLPRELAQSLEIDAAALIQIQNRQRDLEIVGAYGLTTELTLSAPWRAGAAESLADIVASGRTLISNEFDTGTDQPDPARLAAGGFLSMAVIPIFDGARPAGALLAFTRSAGKFEHDRLHCLQSIAVLLSSHLQRQRTELQLIHAQKLEALGQLTGGIAHDVNNLLTVISGNLQLLELQCPADSEQHTYIRDALRSVANGAALTRTLLAFSRRQRLSPTRILPQQLLSDFGDMLRRTLGERIRIDIACGAEVPAVLADAAQLETALLNLALNARDAMPRGGLLTIAARMVDASQTSQPASLRPGGYVEFRVGDCGHGMAPDVLAHALDPFFTTKDGGKGSGLGLSMVYGFVTQSGGEMHIDSRLGYGTTVYLYFPIAHDEAATAHAPGLAPNAVAPAKHPGARILVVEDDPAVRGIAIDFLHSLGYATIAAADAQAALDVVRSRPDIALLFSDVALGNGHNGVELGLAARALRPALPILLTSGYEYSAISQGSPALQSFELLHKPYRIEELDAAIGKLIQSS